MRSIFGLGLAATLALGFAGVTSVACGGKNAGGSGSTDPSAAGTGVNGDPGSAGAGGSGTAADAGPTTTTTAGLDGQNDGGTKLPNAGPTRGPDPGRSKDDIRGIMIARKTQARACYDASLQAHPGIEGDVAIKWTINPKGDVADIAVDTDRSTILEPSVGQCLMTMIMSIKFSESPRGLETHAAYPFNFHPRGVVPANGTGPSPAGVKP